MRSLKWFGVVCAIALSLGSPSQRSARAVEFSDGTVAFERPPSLVGATTTRNGAAASRPTYYFTIEVPQQAGEPLQQVTITQENRSGVLGEVDYESEDSRAFLGSRRQRGEEIPLADVTFNDEANTVSVVFGTPVPPGSTVTIGLRPERNPRSEGVYLFGVTVFPEGENTRGQFIGYGRLHFYDRDNDVFNFSR